MKTFIAVSFATIYGVSLRILFGLLNNFMGIMSVSFLILAPVIIGFFTIILIPKEKTLSNTSAFFKPWLTSLVILLVTMFFNIEGSICWIMIYPLFSVLAGIGGVIAFNYRRKRNYDQDKNDWDSPNTMKISFVLFIPLVVGMLEGDRALTPQEFNISESRIISASSKDVWHQLTNINDISSNECKASFSNLMGFPKHLKTVLDTVSVGGKRKAIYENGLYFDETISKLEPEKLLVLDIKTDPNKIPPTVMDEHIVIGGKHVDIFQDIYSIEKLSETSCRLTLSSRFYINTPFNWYASIWAKYLMADILKSEINLINKRAISNL
jgi:hypothetical protein